jgi:hypothetical protein
MFTDACPVYPDARREKRRGPERLPICSPATQSPNVLRSYTDVRPNQKTNQHRSLAWPAHHRARHLEQSPVLLQGSSGGPTLAEPDAARNRLNISSDRCRPRLRPIAHLSRKDLGIDCRRAAGFVSRRLRLAFCSGQKPSSLHRSTPTGPARPGFHVARQQWATCRSGAIICRVAGNTSAQSRAACFLPRILVTVLQPRVARHSGKSFGVCSSGDPPRSNQRGCARCLRASSWQARVHIHFSERSKYGSDSPLRFIA